MVPYISKAEDIPPDTIGVVRHSLDNSQVDSRHPLGTLLTPNPLKIAFNQVSCPLSLVDSTNESGQDHKLGL